MPVVRMMCCKILRSLDRVFGLEFVKCLCIGAPSKDPARFVSLGFGIFEKQEAQEYKRVPKKQTTTLVLGGEASHGVGAVELQGVALWFVRVAALVKLSLAVPGHPDLYPTILALALEAVLDHALAPDPVAPVFVEEGFLDFRALLELCDLLKAAVKPVARERMTRMPGRDGRGGPVGRMPGWGERLGRVRGAGRLSPCRLLWFVGGKGGCAPFSPCSLRWDWRWWVRMAGGLEEGMWSLLVGVPQQAFARCLHGRLSAVASEVCKFLYYFWGVHGPW